MYATCGLCVRLPDHTLRRFTRKFYRHDTHNSRTPDSTNIIQDQLTLGSNPVVIPVGVIHQSRKDLIPPRSLPKLNK